jgi:hypothetical protein
MSQARRKTHTRDMRNGTLPQPGWLLATPEHQPLLKLLIELTEMWYSAAKKLTTYAIDAAESVAKGVVEGQRLASGWAKDTPVAPLLEEQQTITREFVTRSADVARRLWLLQLEQGEEVVERAEDELLPLARAQA